MCLKFVKEIFRGKDLYRILLNQECATEIIGGKILDIGSGAKPASYHRFLKRKDGSEILFLDLEAGTGENRKKIDLESDPLPFSDNGADTVMLFNVLEHVYNYSSLLREALRVLKSGGRIIGAVPFLVAYHPDPYDFWRYSAETLPRIFSAAGFRDVRVEPFGYGPFSAAYSQIEPFIFRFLKPLALPLFLAADAIVLFFKPNAGKRRYALGLFFTAIK